MNLVFETPAHERTIPFSAIAERGRLGVEQVGKLPAGGRMASVNVTFFSPPPPRMMCIGGMAAHESHVPEANQRSD